ncbi:TetR/AcrR family transcriptional regulator [Caviibacter abscessus]|uniref:TetR/AcrR family transcriptional regulator n=1 Tax=Caviibacter abscessus TaxID=1766719 RepID=UPI00083662A7|nr:TetR/AcrR family transcriptional regulator [Caviibacter abscessus]
MKKNLEQKKRNVLEKSAKLFYYQGYVNTGINEILKECKIPKGSFYYYFKNKDDLLMQIIDYHTDNLILFFDKVVDDLSMVKLKTFFSGYFNSIVKNKCHGGSPLGNFAIELADINEEARERLNFSYEKIEKRVALFLEMIKNTNSKYTNINSQIYSKMLIAQMEGVMFKVKLTRNEEEIENFFRFFDVLVYGD